MELAALCLWPLAGVEEALMWFGAHFGGLTQILDDAQPTRDAGWMDDRVGGCGIDKKWWY